MLNTLLIITVLFIFIAVAIFVFIRSAGKVHDETEDYEDPYSIPSLVEYVNNVFAARLRRSLKDANLTREELEREKRNKIELRLAIKQASLGNMQAKQFIKGNIISIICDQRRLNRVDDITIDKVIPFNNPKMMESRDKFETLLYIFMNARDERSKDGKKYGADGLSVMFDAYGLKKPVPGTNRYIVTADDIDKIYEDVMKEYTLKPADKRSIVAQRIFADLTGKGVVDILLDTSIDEVQGGVSGIPKGAYELKGGATIKGAKFSYESVWIGLSGLYINLDFLTFGSQDELVRVCNNIYKYDAPNVLSRTEGRVVATMLDGSRVVAMRPPFSDSYAFIARKFDSTPSIAPESLLTDRAAEIPIIMSKWIVKGCENTAITGDQGCGKTTFLKSMIRFMREDYSIRVQELTPELNLRYTYPDRNILSFRETDSISAQEGLDFQKKSSGMINILGEVATAEAASWAIQTAKVASKMTIFTHHAKTLKDLIVALRNNLMQVNNYTNDQSVDEMVAASLNVEIHLDRKKGHRYLERITEIMPITDRSYPVSALVPEKYDENGLLLPLEERIKDMSLEDLQKMALVNSDEYQKRITDRELYHGEDLVRYDENKGRYVLLALPSRQMMEDIKASLTKEEEAEMQKDFIKMRKIEKAYRLKEQQAS